MRARLFAALFALAPLGASATPAVTPGAAPPATPVKAAPAPAKAPAKPTATAKLPDLATFTLANGLQVALLHLDGAPVAAVQVWYHAGSKDEPRDRQGSAHMFEHLMFKGTTHVRPEAHATFLTGLGGYVNAATDEDATHYVNTVPAANLDLAIQLEAERMRNLMFHPETIAVEKEVVKEEIRRQENSPLTRGFLRFLAAAYTKHPYAWTAGGNLKDLDATTPADLRRFYDAYYQPNNALLVVVGKVTEAEVRASAEKWFGPIAKGAAPPRPAADAVEPPQTARRREVADPSQLGLCIVGFHVPPARHDDIYALQLASLILGGGESSRLKVRLKAEDPKTKKLLAVDGGVEALIREDPGLLITLAAYRDPAEIDAIEAAITDELAKLAAKGPTKDELRKAKNAVQSGFVFSLEDAAGLADQIGRSWILTADPRRFLRDVDALEAVTAADVARVTKTYLAPDRATVVVIPPKGN
jgi:zinc protease